MGVCSSKKAEPEAPPPAADPAPAPEPAPAATADAPVEEQKEEEKKVEAAGAPVKGKTPPSLKGTGCCGFACDCCCTKDVEDKPLYTPEELADMQKMNTKHPVLDRPDRRNCGTFIFNSDWPSLLIFLVAVLITIGMWWVCVYMGQVEIALYGMNWMGNICGQNGAGKFQAWINPTMISSVYASSVCMPECPSIYRPPPVNDTAKFNALDNVLGKVTDTKERDAAQSIVTEIEGRVTSLKKQNKYMKKQLGSTMDELDMTKVFCLCNGQKSDLAAEFFYYTDSAHHINVSEQCSLHPANVNGYIELNYNNGLKKYLGEDENYLGKDGAKVMDKVPCAFKYRTEPVFTRCVPWVTADTLGRLTLVIGTKGMGSMVQSMANSFSQRVVSWSNDIQKAKWIMIPCCVLSLLLSIGLVYLMCCSCGTNKNDELICACLEYVVWGTLFGLLLAYGLCCGVCAWQFKHYKDLTELKPEPTTHAEDQTSMYIYGVGMCVAGIAFVLQLVMMVCFCDAIEKSVKIMIAASEVFYDAWGLLLYPLFHNLTIFIAIIFWLIGLCFVATAGTKSVEPDGVHTLTYDKNFQYALAFYGFMIIWIVEFMSAVGFMIICAAILIAFFNHYNKNQVTDVEGAPVVATEKDMHKGSPVYDAFGLILGNHMGTAAIGSFFIAVVVVIRWVLTYLSKKAAEKSKSKIAKYIAACIACILKCFEDCMRYMVRSAYILTVLEGRWFFSAVCGGMWAIWSNLSLIAIANYIAFIILWMCKLCVPLLCTAIAHLMLKSGKFGCTEDDLSSSFVVLIPVAAVSCVFSFTAMGLLDTSIEVVMMTFCKLKDIDDKYPAMMIMKKVPGYVARLTDRFHKDLADGKEAEDKQEMENKAAEGETSEKTGLISGEEKKEEN